MCGIYVMMYVICRRRVAFTANLGLKCIVLHYDPKSHVLTLKVITCIRSPDIITAIDVAILHPSKECNRLSCKKTLIVIRCYRIYIYMPVFKLII